MPARQHRRYPWDALWAWASARGLTMKDLERRSGSDRRELYRWRSAGSVPETAADRVAVKLGTVPGLIWPEWEADGQASVERAEAERRARDAAKTRRLRRTNPEYAERQRAITRAWKAECPDYVRAQKRAYNARHRERLNEASRIRKQRWRDRQRLQAEADYKEVNVLHGRDVKDGHSGEETAGQGGMPPSISCPGDGSSPASRSDNGATEQEVA